MFQRFRAEYAPLRADVPAGSTWQHERLAGVEGYLDFASEFAGATFGSGLYRVHDDTSGANALSMVADAFPEYATRICPFGYDWLGRQFAVDSGRVLSGQPQVLLLEPGTGEALEIPLSFAAFHDEELIDLRTRHWRRDSSTRGQPPAANLYLCAATSAWVTESRCSSAAGT